MATTVEALRLSGFVDRKVYVTDGKRTGVLHGVGLIWAYVLFPGARSLETVDPQELIIGRAPIKEDTNT